MRVICAGLPKSGTKSVASALRILGYNNVHDLEDHWIHHLDEYVDAVEGKPLPDFAKMYANVDAVTDLPACFFWEEIFAAFPEAKVVLMVRDSEEVWVESFRKTLLIYYSIGSSWWARLTSVCTPTGRKFNRLNGALAAINLGLAPGSSIVKGDVYTTHNTRVMSTVPQNQLLAYNVKQGWKPLCEFLDVDVPDVPFPRLNVKSELIEALFTTSQIQKRMTMELIWVVGLLYCFVLVCCIVFFGF